MKRLFETPWIRTESQTESTGFLNANVCLEVVNSYNQNEVSASFHGPRCLEYCRERRFFNARLDSVSSNNHRSDKPNFGSFLRNIPWDAWQLQCQQFSRGGKDAVNVVCLHFLSLTGHVPRSDGRNLKAWRVAQYRIQWFEFVSYVLADFTP